MSMNLSGSLDAFGLDEVLALVGMGGRTGRMAITSPTAAGAIHFVDGEVSAASADCARAGLLRRVVGVVGVPVSAVGAAVGAGDPVLALVDAGHVDLEAVHGIARDHVVDEIGEMLAWPQGEFEVALGVPDPGDFGLRLPIHEVVAQARARRLQWDELGEVLPTADTVLDVVATPGQAPTLDLEEWALLARIDGHRTLAEVVARAGSTPIAASQRLVALMERGLVREHSSDADADLDELDRILEAFERPGSMAAPAPVLGLAPTPAVQDDPAEWGAEVVTLQVVAAVPDLAEDDAPVEDGLDQPFAVEQLAEAVELAPGLVEPVEPVELAPEPVEPEAVEPVALEPIAYEPVALEPVELAPVALEPELEWSPWTQALGLGRPAPAGEWVEDPLAGPGIAEMIAGAAGRRPVEEAPLPLAPEWRADLSPEPSARAEVQVALVPGPRDAQWDAELSDVETPGVAVVGIEDSAEPEAVPAVAPAAVQAEEPLAGGLLSQLISGVRGL